MKTPKLLSRDEFRAATFQRDGHKCVICGALGTLDAKGMAPDLDAHHIIERRLWDDGGYYTENGASLCPVHHPLAEQTVLSCEEIRAAAGIEQVVLPDHFYKDVVYTKWGDICLPNGTRVKGELFFDESVQKVLDQGGVLGDYTDYVKYQRTYHCPWSNMTKDDRMREDMHLFVGKEVVITAKLDGENCLDGSVVVLTDDGAMSIREICETKYGGNVISFNIESGKLESKAITAHQIMDSTDDEWFEVETHSGEVLTVTGNHLVWLPDLFCYRRVRDLRGDENFLLNDL